MAIIYLIVGVIVVYVFYWLLSGKSGSESTDRREQRSGRSQNSFPRKTETKSSPHIDANEEERRRAAIKNIMEKRTEEGNIEPTDAAKVVTQWMKKTPKKKS